MGPPPRPAGNPQGGAGTILQCDLKNAVLFAYDVYPTFLYVASTTEVLVTLLLPQIEKSIFYCLPI